MSRIFVTVERWFLRRKSASTTIRWHSFIGLFGATTFITGCLSMATDSRKPHRFAWWSNAPSGSISRAGNACWMRAVGMAGHWSTSRGIWDAQE